MKKLLLLIPAILFGFGLQAQSYIFSTNPGGNPLLAIPNTNGNVVIGEAAGVPLTSGGSNTVIGTDAGAAMTTGFLNTFVGRKSGESTIGSGDNTFVGGFSGANNVSGGENVFVGSFTGERNISGSFNSFLGRYSGRFNQTGAFNTYVGYGAGLNNVNGSNNVFLGRSAGENDTTSDKLYIDNSGTSTPLIYGDFDQNLLSVNGFMGVSKLDPGADLHIKQSNSSFPNPTTGGLRLESSGGTNWQLWNSNNYLSIAYEATRVAYINNSTGAYVTTSDIRLKKDIEPMTNTLDRVVALRPVTYHYLHQDANAPKVQGFIAQEVETLFPEAVHVDEGGDLRGISYADFGVIAIKAIQEQQEIISAQQTAIEKLTERLEQLEKQASRKK